MSARPAPPATFNPRIVVADPAVRYWLAQVTLRLRREVTWGWHQRGAGEAMPAGVLPPRADPVQASLDLTRFQREKDSFFTDDATAAYLTGQIENLEAPALRDPPRGSWQWTTHTLGLDRAAQFVLACALSARADAAMAAVCAACHNDPSQTWPTLALAQRLWEVPLEIVACTDPGHPLYRYGLLTPPVMRDGGEWHRPIEMPAVVARTFLEADIAWPAALRPMDERGAPALDVEAHPLIARLLSESPNALQVVPMEGPRGSDFERWALALAQVTERAVVRLADTAATDHAGLAALATVCWLNGRDVLLPAHWRERGVATATDGWYGAVSALPLRWYMPVTDADAGTGLPSSFQMPAFLVPRLSVPERTTRLAEGLGQGAPAAVRAAAAQAARRFRLPDRALERVIAAAATLRPSAGADDLFALCRGEARVELDGLATPVTPRFTLNELVLPAAQARQIREIRDAMNALGRVHYQWGTARVWNESGLSVLFCGPPGTGKTMAAEALAADLGLPMFRVDLSQVMNKYIGETEKNLRRIFDAAETSDCVLFFDEADALFGRRIDVKDAHDRFANIQVSFLLERMERFRGLGVLASNRRKELDDAFTRRLRYIVEFPVPGAVQREAIWRQVFPRAISARGVDFAWLGEQFELSGGHIRSAAFNACLQAAAHGETDRPRVAMADVVLAVKRELQKMNRVAGAELFGRYASTLGADA